MSLLLKFFNHTFTSKTCLGLCSQMKTFQSNKNKEYKILSKNFSFVWYILLEKRVNVDLEGEMFHYVTPRYE